MPFDTEKFIKEVEARPSLWNNNSPEFEKKALKNRGWKELCNIFVHNYPAMDSAAKNREVIGLQRKWKSLRDSFNRELKARRLDGEGTSDQRRNSCPYFEQLSFLRPILEARIREEPPVDPLQEQPRTSTSEEVPVHGIPCKRKRSTGPAIEPPEFIDDVNGAEERNSDLHFFHSLLPYFKLLSPTSKLNLKLSFMSMIKKHHKRRVKPPVVNEQEGSSRTTPAIVNGNAGPSRSVQEEEQQEEEEAEEDLEDYTSDTSPGLSAGYTDESPETED